MCHQLNNHKRPFYQRSLFVYQSIKNKKEFNYMSYWEIKECYYCKQNRKFYIHAGKYGAFYSCEICRRTINITRNPEEAKKLFPNVYNENSTNNNWLEYEEF